MVEDQETIARRFSHEIHDELGQTLAALKSNIAAVYKKKFDIQPVIIVCTPGPGAREL